MTPRSKNGRFLDGCHRVSWIIQLIGTAVMIGILWGALNTKVDIITKDFGERITRLENIMLGYKAK